MPSLIFTGGHHTSALAVALELKNRGWDIHWFGHRHSLWGDRSDSSEYLEVTKNGIKFYELKAGKVYNTLHPKKLARLPYGFVQAFILVRQLKSIYRTELKGIVTFGGYLGVPVVFAGWLLGIPVIAHEQTVVAGWANRFIARFAKVVAVSWPNSQKHYPASKTVLTGLPLRPQVMSSHQNKHQTIAGHIYVTGGKQGSHVINQAVFEGLRKLLEKFTVTHQTGQSSLHNDYSKGKEIKSKLPPHLAERYLVYSYLNPEMAAAELSASEIVIGRAGAHTVQELALFGTRCVLVPLPNSSHNEQYENAKMLANAHQAVILPQERLSSGTLIESVEIARTLRPVNVEVIKDGLMRVVNLIEKTVGQ